jgi:hypothetical protein
MTCAQQWPSITRTFAEVVQNKHFRISTSHSVTMLKLLDTMLPRCVATSPRTRNSKPCTEYSGQQSACAGGTAPMERRSGLLFLSTPGRHHPVWRKSLSRRSGASRFISAVLVQIGQLIRYDSRSSFATPQVALAKGTLGLAPDTVPVSRKTDLCHHGSQYSCRRIASPERELSRFALILSYLPVLAAQL